MKFVEFLPCDPKNGDTFEVTFEFFNNDKILKIQLIKNSCEIIKSQIFNLDFLFQLDDKIIRLLLEMSNK